MKIYKTYTAEEGKWLYRDFPEGRVYCTHVSFSAEKAEPWAECTNEEKEQWEKDHPQPEPDEN